ncbi:hypothetical protein ACFL1H_06565, partial [Nanoarchaeota archaeon]
MKNQLNKTLKIICMILLFVFIFSFVNATMDIGPPGPREPLEPSVGRLSISTIEGQVRWIGIKGNHILFRAKLKPIHTDETQNFHLEITCNNNQTIISEPDNEIPYDSNNYPTIEFLFYNSNVNNFEEGQYICKLYALGDKGAEYSEPIYIDTNRYSYNPDEYRSGPNQNTTFLYIYLIIIAISLIFLLVKLFPLHKIKFTIGIVIFTSFFIMFLIALTCSCNLNQSDIYVLILFALFALIMLFVIITPFLMLKEHKNYLYFG